MSKKFDPNRDYRKKVSYTKPDLPWELDEVPLWSHVVSIVDLKSIADQYMPDTVMENGSIDYPKILAQFKNDFARIVDPGSGDKGIFKNPIALKRRLRNVRSRMKFGGENSIVEIGFTGLLVGMDKFNEEDKERFAYVLAPGHVFPREKGVGERKRFAFILLDLDREPAENDTTSRFRKKAFVGQSVKYIAFYGGSQNPDYAVVKVKFSSNGNIDVLGKIKHFEIPKISRRLPAGDLETLYYQFPNGLSMRETKHPFEICGPGKIWDKGPFKFALMQATYGASGAPVFVKERAKDKYQLFGMITSKANLIPDFAKDDEGKTDWNLAEPCSSPNDGVKIMTLDKIYDHLKGLKLEGSRGKFVEEVLAKVFSKGITENVARIPTIPLLESPVFQGDLLEDAPPFFQSNGELVFPQEGGSRSWNLSSGQPYCILIEGRRFKLWENTSLEFFSGGENPPINPGFRSIVKNWPLRMIQPENELELRFDTNIEIKKPDCEIFPDQNPVTVLGGIGLADFIDELPNLGCNQLEQRIWVVDGHLLEVRVSFNDHLQFRTVNGGPDIFSIHFDDTRRDG